MHSQHGQPNVHIGCRFVSCMVLLGDATARACSKAVAPEYMHTRFLELTHQRLSLQLPPPAPKSDSLLPSIGRLSTKRGGSGMPPTPAGTIPLATAGRVELCGRALLPPGVDDLVLSIFDDEPTSIIAYFLTTRCFV